MRWAALALFAALGGCAVKGYDLGWRTADRLTPLLGAPGDGLDGCRIAPDRAPAPVCEGAAADVAALLKALSPTADAPTALGFTCRDVRCSYANAWERRDVGLAAVVPVYRRVVLREVRLAAAQQNDGRWGLETLLVRDSFGPEYGPVRVGGALIE